MGRALVYLVSAAAALFFKDREMKDREAGREVILQEMLAARAEKNAEQAEAAPAAPVTPIKHIIPENPELAAYMRDLPQAVTGIADAKRLAAKLESEQKIGLWQTALGRVIALIPPNEFLYAMTWNAHCVSMERGEKKNHRDSHGIVFFSDRRFFYFKDPANIIEFPLVDIYAVDAFKGDYFDGISFRTQNLDLQLSFAGKTDRKLFRDMVIFIAANAANPQISEEFYDASAQICECPGCGATVIIHAEVINKCEYCGRHVEKQAKTGVADELKKLKFLLDAGALSADEFEAAKNKVLGRV